MRLIDANILLRYLLNDNMQQKVLADEAIQYGSCTTIEVIAEVVHVLLRVYKVSRSEISMAIHHILLDVKVENLKSLRYALGLFNQTSLDFVDCLLVAYHKVLGVDILSFDKKLNSALEKNFHIYQIDLDQLGIQ
jgi:predicted nucleic-acid-binding protein